MGSVEALPWNPPDIFTSEWYRGSKVIQLKASWNPPDIVTSDWFRGNPPDVVTS